MRGFVAAIAALFCLALLGGLVGVGPAGGGPDPAAAKKPGGGSSGGGSDRGYHNGNQGNGPNHSGDHNQDGHPDNGHHHDNDNDDDDDHHPPPPPPDPDPDPEQPPVEEPQTPTEPANVSSGGVSSVAGTSAKGHSSHHHSNPKGHSQSSGEVIIPPSLEKKERKPHKEAKKPKGHKVVPAAPITGTVAAVAAATNPERSGLANRLLSPTDLELDGEHLAGGGLIALLLAALLYLPVMIFNKATEKNHDEVRKFLARPRAWTAAIMATIPFAGNPVATLAMGVVATTALFSFVEPGFPTEAGSLQYLIGMFLGFTVVSTVFFLTWRIVLHRLEPESEGKWEIFPPTSCSPGSSS